MDGAISLIPDNISDLQPITLSVTSELEEKYLKSGASVNSYCSTTTTTTTTTTVTQSIKHRYVEHSRKLKNRVSTQPPHSNALTIAKTLVLGAVCSLLPAAAVYSIEVIPHNEHYNLLHDACVVGMAAVGSCTSALILYAVGRGSHGRQLLVAVLPTAVAFAIEVTLIDKYAPYAQENTAKFAIYGGLTVATGLATAANLVYERAVTPLHQTQALLGNILLSRTITDQQLDKILAHDMQQFDSGLAHDAAENRLQRQHEREAWAHQRVIVADFCHCFVGCCDSIKMFLLMILSICCPYKQSVAHSLD